VHFWRQSCGQVCAVSPQLASQKKSPQVQAKPQSCEHVEVSSPHWGSQLKLPHWHVVEQS
jgi:hypothetical protein